MPNRVVREGILDSERVNKLSWPGEVFYRRMMSVVDDFGRYDGRASLLRSKLFPLRIDKVSIADVEKWLTECVGAGLVSMYYVNQKPYVELLDFNQTVRIKKPRFPPPDEHAIQMQADDKQMSSACLSETETNPNPNPDIESESKPAHARDGPKLKILKVEKQPEKIIQLPWESEAFSKTWDEWKNYRWKEKRQKFKTEESELQQLKRLYEISNGEEKTATAIIRQSMGNGWQGLFELKNNNKNNGANKGIVRSPEQNVNQGAGFGSL